MLCAFLVPIENRKFDGKFKETNHAKGNQFCLNIQELND